MSAHDLANCNDCRSVVPCPALEATKREPRAVVNLGGVDHSLSEAELLALAVRVGSALEELANRLETP